MGGERSAGIRPSTHFGTESKSGGSGLGLAIGKQLEEAYGGRAWAESRLGEASRLSVELPIAENR
ncbi:MAG TPA: ATP-binding protein [Chloroflexota bacterium]|nr:ATP-binding protein [Chloroflexota bacterium]